MRQSSKETALEWMMREGLIPERREALALSRQEFSEELGSNPLSSSIEGKRTSRHGRG